MTDIFIAYSQQDLALKKELKIRLNLLERQGRISLWDDFDLEAGEAWDETIKQRLYGADVVLLLVSSDFLASDYCHDEMNISLERHRKNETFVTPVILRHCDWKYTPLDTIEVIPEKGRPVMGLDWPTRDEAWQDVITRLRRVIEKVEEKKRNKILEAEKRVKFDALIQSGQQLLKKNNWKEAEIAFSNALKLHLSGFEPSRPDVQAWIQACKDAIKKQKDEKEQRITEEKQIREEKIRKAEAIRIKEQAEAILAKEAQALLERQKAEQDRLDRERKQRDDAQKMKDAAPIKPTNFAPAVPPKKEEAPKEQQYTAPAPATMKPVLNKPEEKDAGNNTFIGGITFISFLIFLIHYSLRIKSFEYVAPHGHWSTVLILSLISTVLFGLVIWIVTRMSASKNDSYEVLGGLLIIAFSIFLLYGFYKPIYTYYAFDTGLLLKPGSNTVSQENGTNASQMFATSAQPDSVVKQADPTTEKTGENLPSVSDEPVAILSVKKYYLIESSYSTLTNSVYALKKFKSSGENGYLGVCKKDAGKYYIVVDTIGHLNLAEAKKDAAKRGLTIKPFKPCN